MNMSCLDVKHVPVSAKLSEVYSGVNSGDNRFFSLTILEVRACAGGLKGMIDCLI